MSVEYNDTNDTVLAVTWKAFADPYLGINLDVVNDYAIAVFVQSKSHVALNQVTKWIHLQTESLHFDPKTNQVKQQNFYFQMIGIIYCFNVLL